MKKINYVQVFGMLMLSVGLLACEGPTGPEGPQGPQGEQGAQGEQGPEGTANVMYSDWFNLGDVASPADTTILGSNFSRYHVDAPELTQDIIDNGTIIVYYQLSGMITPLPFTIAQGSSVVTISYAPLIPGRLTILSQQHDNTSFNLNSGTQFRYVLIPGGQTLSKGLDLRSLSYKKLIDLFKIPE